MRPSEQSDQSRPRRPHPYDAFVARSHGVATVTTIPRPTDRDAWLAARRPWFNASAAATLVRRAPVPHAHRRRAGQARPRPPSRYENAAMRRGTYLEPAIAEWWSDEHGIAALRARRALRPRRDRWPRSTGASSATTPTPSRSRPRPSYVTRPEPLLVVAVPGADVLPPTSSGSTSPCSTPAWPGHLRRRA